MRGRDAENRRGARGQGIRAARGDLGQNRPGSETEAALLGQCRWGPGPRRPPAQAPVSPGVAEAGPSRGGGRTREARRGGTLSLPLLLGPRGQASLSAAGRGLQTHRRTHRYTQRHTDIDTQRHTRSHTQTPGLFSALRAPGSDDWLGGPGAQCFPPPGPAGE